MKKFIVKSEKSGMRLDKFLVEQFGCDFTRGEIIGAIKSGKVLVNKNNSKPSRCLKNGDEILFDVKKNIVKIKPNSESNKKIEIIYTDENIIVVNKPARLVVHPSQNFKGDTLVDFLLDRFPEIEHVHDDSRESAWRPGIVQRLDKETSGVMVIARTQESFVELKKLFQTRQIKKEYLAIVYGIPTEKIGCIEKDIAKSSNYKKQVIAGKKTKTKTRMAITEYQVLKSGRNYSLVMAMPKTGRMHQIRVHLASIGHPLVGDKIYLSKKIKKENQQRVERHMLHANQISFSLNGKEYDFSVLPPDDFLQFQGKFINSAEDDFES